MTVRRTGDQKHEATANSPASSCCFSAGLCVKVFFLSPYCFICDEVRVCMRHMSNAPH